MWYVAHDEDDTHNEKNKSALSFKISKNKIFQTSQYYREPPLITILKRRSLMNVKLNSGQYQMMLLNMKPFSVSFLFIFFLLKMIL